MNLTVNINQRPINNHYHLYPNSLRHQNYGINPTRSRSKSDMGNQSNPIKNETHYIKSRNLKSQE